jgi:SusD/RagB-like outer membrane lipoprotein
MRLSIITYPAIIFFSAVLIASCGFDEENLPKEKITSVNLDEILPVAITQAAYNQSAIGGRGSGIFIQILADGQDMIFRPFSSYNLFPANFDELWDDGLYGGSLSHASVIQKQAKMEGATQYEAIAKILLACEFGTVASVFGDIPFSEALDGNKYPKPSFDKQEDVYSGIQDLLVEAIDLIDQSSDPGPTNDDLLYGGNMELWKKFAYGLKARSFLQASKRQPENYATILEIVQGKSFASLSEQADFDWSLPVGSDNPLYTFGVQRPGAMIVDNDYALSLIDNADPRTTKIIGEMVYGGWQYFQKGNTNLHWAQSNSAIPFLSYVEIKFMEAEALLKTNAVISLVSSVLYEAIEASFVQMDLDPVVNADFIAVRASLDDFSDDEEILQHIIEEAYVAYYGFAFRQAWCNYRRTGYPFLIPKGFQTEYNPSGNIPQRFLYPDNERNFNAINTEDAIGRQNGAKLDVPVWSFE